MANVYAIKSGNWSDITLWNTGALPTSDDLAFANAFNVTIDVNATVQGIRNGAAAPIVSGGSFIAANGVSITKTSAFVGNVVENGVTNILTIATGITFTINGPIFGAAGNGNAIVISAGGTLNVIGNVSSGGGTLVGGIVNSGTLNIIGDVSKPSGGNGAPISNAGTLNITGNFFTLGSNSSAAVLISSGTAIITGTSNGNSTAAINTPSVSISGGQLTFNGNAVALLSPGISVSGTGTLILNGTIFASQNSVGLDVTSASADVVINGPLINNGQMSAMRAFVFRVPSSPLTWDTFLMDTNNLPTVLNRLYSLGADPSFPAAANVRQGTTYGQNLVLVGTMAVPPASSVSRDVPIDSTVGTAELTASDFWNYQTSLITADNSIGVRLKNIATTQTVGDQVSALK